ncbi:hypothetical protein BJY52DRAFT_99429 [Lactarius psammicola]|nr:hypothetical protein BJY52DRAFT_99429 [Lactarius psammicola]
MGMAYSCPRGQKMTVYHIRLALSFEAAACPSCKSGRETTDCWPPLPIALWYPKFQLPIPDDEDNIMVALEYPDCGRQINLVVPDSFLWTSKTRPVEGAVPRTVQLASLGVGGMSSSALPRTFLGGSALRLCYLHSCKVAFPTLPRLLSFAQDLVSLRLNMIPRSDGFPQRRWSWAAR